MAACRFLYVVPHVTNLIVLNINFVSAGTVYILPNTILDCYFMNFRWYTNYNEMIGAIAIFLTAAVAVVWNYQYQLGAGKVGLALFSVFQVSYCYCSSDSYVTSYLFSEYGDC
jgi:hypothetical protein